jgi:hypothetical protein
MARPESWSYTKQVREQIEKENFPFVKASFAEGHGLRHIDKDDLE